MTHQYFEDFADFSYNGVMKGSRDKEGKFEDCEVQIRSIKFKPVAMSQIDKKLASYVLELEYVKMNLTSPIRFLYPSMSKKFLNFLEDYVRHKFRVLLAINHRSSIKSDINLMGYYTFIYEDVSQKFIMYVERYLEVSPDSSLIFDSLRVQRQIRFNIIEKNIANLKYLNDSLSETVEKLEAKLSKLL